MIPQIPDNFYKIIFAIGLFLVGYSWLQTEKYNNLRKVNERKFDSITDSINTRSDKVDKEKKDLIDYASEESKELSLPSPIYTRGDTSIFFTNTTGGPRAEVTLSRLISKKWDRYVNNNRIDKEQYVRQNKTLTIINRDIGTLSHL
jgi:hypothetical protein